MPSDWTRQEVEAVIADYLDMLCLELTGQSYNKAEHNRRLQTLTGRTHGSIERKHQNISAILIELGFPYIEGYKPLGNYQDLLRETLNERLSSSDSKALIKTVSENVIAPVEAAPTIPNLSDLCVPPPESSDKPPTRIYEKTKGPMLHKRNYLELEARNQSLGNAGEELILRYEHERLWKLGQHRLADRIEHVSRTKGDGLGYDIVSFEESGKERFIEVKTTRYGALTPFFASVNEVEVSESQKDFYHLYRLFNFSKEPQFFNLPGALRNTCQLSPINFIAKPN